MNISRAADGTVRFQGADAASPLGPFRARLALAGDTH